MFPGTKIISKCLQMTLVSKAIAAWTVYSGAYNFLPDPVAQGKYVWTSTLNENSQTTYLISGVE